MQEQRHVYVSVPVGYSDTGDTNALETEYIPFVEERFRVSGKRILFGHSLGGLFAIYYLFNAADTFDGVIAASPSLYWNGQSQLLRAADVLGDAQTFNHHLYVTMGGERDEMVDSANGLGDIAAKYSPPGFSQSYDFMPERDHGGTPLITIENGLRFVYDGSSFE